MIELTEDQQHALDASPEPKLIDPRNRKTYVLVGADVFERMRTMLTDDEGLGMSYVAELVERAMRDEDIGDPTLEFYQQQYGRKQ